MLKVSVLNAALIGTAFFFAWSGVAADSPCQGRPRGSCESDSRCVWVDGYKRSDGVEVDAYCRAKPGEADGGRTEPKKETKKEPKPEPKKETKKEPKPEPKKETKKEPKPEPKKETKKPKPEPKKETKKPKPEPKKETKKETR